jgi:hypothetical protein
MKAQWDTIYLDIPELKVNNSSFLYDLDTMFQKSYLCKEGKNSIYAMYVEQKSEGIFLLTIVQAPLERGRLAGAKGFFETNGMYIFVKGIGLLSEYPKGLFTITDNKQQFYYVKHPEHIISFDGECWVDLEYKDDRLSFLKKYW